MPQNPSNLTTGTPEAPALKTTFVTSSIRRHIKENSRTYHRYKEGKYLSPNDEIERDRLKFYHAVQLEILNQKLYLAPIGENPQRILDCGTGTGIWALDMGDLFPSAVVTGVDVKFEIDDLDFGWTFQKNTFEFIHALQLVTGIRDRLRFLHKFSNSPNQASNSTQWAKDAGFVDVQIVKIKQPPKDKRLKHVGCMIAATADARGHDAYFLALFTRFGGLTEEEGKKICAEASEEAQMTTHIHAYNWLCHVYGHKPEEEKASESQQEVVVGRTPRRLQRQSKY
ncbi:hypothetical protein EX30DRAFT_395926 [Ascodesmis nigricans]|uniref:S-adenosyl-L-methionine-dependent methyltransferase n=1 Tax=Ascodesmis nigricans TaxID=341454 RepID=A0A4S2MX36_9PEZI|nr:hypothetical protein EX30DRAFT_395926 [Ascodesmis nigricans]